MQGWKIRCLALVITMVAADVASQGIHTGKCTVAVKQQLW